MQMDAIVTRLKEIDSAAAAILDHTAEAKQELQDRMQKKTQDFDQKLAEDTSAATGAGKARMQARIEKELAALTADTNNRIQSTEDYYQQHKDQIAGEIFKQVTGQEWQA
jgi:pantothenate kinase-related protein Tda10